MSRTKLMHGTFQNGINAQNMNMGQNLNRDDGWKREESTAVKVRKGRLHK